MKINRRSMFTKRSTLSMKNNRHLKPLILAVSLSIIIGTIFGVTALNMIKNEVGNLDNDHQTHYQSQLVSDDYVDQGDEARTLPVFELYVIQAGVFTEKENAQQWKEHFSALYPAVTWLVDDQYYLLVDFALMKEKVNQRAKEMSDSGYDVFVKEWHIPNMDIKLNETSYEWFEMFLDKWRKSFVSLEENADLDVNQWESLVVKDALYDARIEIIQDKIMEHLIHSRLESGKELKKAHIDLLKEYEAVITN